MPAGMFDGEKYVGLDSAAIFWTSSKIVDVIMNGAIITLNYVMLEKKSSGITRSRGGDVEVARQGDCGGHFVCFGD